MAVSNFFQYFSKISLTKIINGGDVGKEVGGHRKEVGTNGFGSGLGVCRNRLNIPNPINRFRRRFWGLPKPIECT